MCPFKRFFKRTLCANAMLITQIKAIYLFIYSNDVLLEGIIKYFQITAAGLHSLRYLTFMTSDLSNLHR